MFIWYGPLYINDRYQTTERYHDNINDKQGTRPRRQSKCEHEKASAILQAMRTLHSEDCRMNEEITGNLLWAASDLIDDAIQADADFVNEQKEKDLWVRYQQVPGNNQQIKAVK